MAYYNSPDADVISRKLQVTKSEQNEIEQSTRGATYSARWFKERQGRITGSKAYKIIQGEDPNSIVNDVMATSYSRDTGYAGSQYGIDHEPRAIQKYKAQRHQRGESFTLTEVGLLIDLKNGELAATPDGLVSEEYGSSGVIEVKCPYGARYMSPMEAVRVKQDNPEFPLEFWRGELTMKKANRVYVQVQMEMAITERQWCDFILYTNPDHQVLVVRVPFDEAFWNKTRTTLLNFHKTYIVPELIRRRF